MSLINLCKANGRVCLQALNVCVGEPGEYDALVQGDAGDRGERAAPGAGDWGHWGELVVRSCRQQVTLQHNDPLVIIDYVPNQLHYDFKGIVLDPIGLLCVYLLLIHARTNDHDWKITYYFPALGSSKFDFIHVLGITYLVTSHEGMEWNSGWTVGRMGCRWLPNTLSNQTTTSPTVSISLGKKAPCGGMLMFLASEQPCMVPS